MDRKSLESQTNQSCIRSLGGTSESATVVHLSRADEELVGAFLADPKVAKASASLEFRSSVCELRSARGRGQPCAGIGLSGLWSESRQSELITSESAEKA